MSKMHLTYLINGRPSGRPLCRSNNNRPYRVGRAYMAYLGVFQSVEAKDRCTHCDHAYRAIQNRKQAAQAPRRHPFAA